MWKQFLIYGDYQPFHQPTHIFHSCVPSKDVHHCRLEHCLQECCREGTCKVLILVIFSLYFRNRVRGFRSLTHQMGMRTSLFQAMTGRSWRWEWTMEVKGWGWKSSGRQRNAPVWLWEFSEALNFFSYLPFPWVSELASFLMLQLTLQTLFFCSVVFVFTDDCLHSPGRL